MGGRGAARRAAANAAAAQAQGSASGQKDDKEGGVFLVNKPPPPRGWTRYIDPESERTYLYCEASEEWHWEEDESLTQAPPPPPPAPSGPKSPQQANVIKDTPAEEVQQYLPGLSSMPTHAAATSRKAEQRTKKNAPARTPTVSTSAGSPAPASPPSPPPPPPPRPKTSAAGPPIASSTPDDHATAMGTSAQLDFAAEDPEVVALAQRDPIVRDLVKDEMRLRKKLREVEALESAAAGGQRLDAAQTAKLSKRAAILADLATVREQINEARQQLEKPQASRQTAADEQPAGSSGNNSKRKNAQKARGPQKAAPPVDPLSQRGRAAMPINPLLAAAASEGGSASRIAAIAPSSTVKSSHYPINSSGCDHEQPFLQVTRLKHEAR